MCIHTDYIYSFESYHERLLRAQALRRTKERCLKLESTE